MPLAPPTSPADGNGGPWANDQRATVLEVKDLCTDFHLRRSTARAVDGVSFSVRAGECLGLVGESGCGKTTIGLSVMQLLPNVGHIASGSVRLNGRELVGLDDREMQKVRGNEVGMIFQDPMSSLNPTWTIGRQIAEPVRLHKRVSKAEAMERALEVLRLVGMPRPEERIRQYPHQLSGGLRQRVMIAIALSCEPKLLIADEPTTALDVTIQAQILNLIDELRQRLNMAVLLITHDMGVIANRTDRVMVMYAGKVAEGATTVDLFDTMRHPYSEALFESIPRLDQDRSRRLYSIPGLPPDLSKALTGCRFAPRCRHATGECTATEPLLAPGPGPSPAAGAPVVGATPLFGPGSPTSMDDHVFACYHPVTATRAQRSAFQAGGDGNALATQPRLPGAAAVSGPDLLAGDVLVAPDGAVPVPVKGPLTGVAARTAPPAAMADREVVLRVDQLVKEFTVTAGAIAQRVVGTIKAVSTVTFSVHRGETFGLVGESGCGKTTIGRLVVALERPTAGSIKFEGEEISTLRGRRLRQRRRDLQLMFQDPYSSLDPRMRVRTTLREPLVIQGSGSAREQDQRISDVLNEVGLSAKAGDLYPHEFSGGQRQRIGLARALVLRPKLIVADEPVSALDVSVQAQILNLMRALQERHDLTYIVISHDLAVVKYLADTIGVMYLGKLVEMAPAEELYARAAHPYTRALIDTIPVPDPAQAQAGRARVLHGELASALSPPSGCRFRTRCPFAQVRCAEEEPLLRPFGPRHIAACHFPLQTPLAGDESAAVGAASTSGSASA